MLSIEHIARTCGATYLVEPADPSALVNGISWDSRTMTSGQAYLALPGERVDGHDFVLASLQAGAIAALVMHELPADVLDCAREFGAAILLVDDTAQAYTAVARMWRTMLPAKVIGITGSSGKTTTKNLVRDVLSSVFRTTATQANQNNELGVPRTLLAASTDDEAVIVEMGMRGLGQLEELCEFVHPDMGLITNVGTCHMELLGTQENIARAKAELFDALPEGGIAFVNALDGHVVEQWQRLKLDERGVRTVFYAGDGPWTYVDELAITKKGLPFVWADNTSFDADGRPSFTMCADGFGKGLQKAECTLEMRGRHNVSNACAAAAVGIAMGLPLRLCAQVLSQSVPDAGRSRVVRATCGACVVDDAYNANPDSMEASLSTFAVMNTDGRRIAVLGDMAELGPYAEEGHARIGAFAANCGLDMLYYVGEYAQTVIEAAQAAGMDGSRMMVLPDAQAVLAELARQLRSDDIVLVKASNFLGFKSIVEGLVE